MSFGRPNDEVKIHGQHACRALFQRRPDDIVRVYIAEDLLRPFSDLLRACAQTRRPYRVVSPEELERITESRHHEGICLVARPRPARGLEDILRPQGPSVVVALADVANPHNIGAILRIAAHFGARAALLSGATHRLAPAAARTAEGGAEWLDVVFARALLPALDVCRAHGHRVLATSSHGGRALYAQPLPARAVLLLGSEGDGLPPELLAAADDLISIPGTGHVESLNVASAASVVLAELWRQRTHAPQTDHSSSKKRDSRLPKKT